jgi:hypothetical protein
MSAMMNDDDTGSRTHLLRWLVWGGAAVLLSLPAVAMAWRVEGVDWTASDFVAMGAILAVACGSFEVVMRMSGNWLYRAAGAVAIGAAFLLVWANLAVGLVAEGANAFNLAFMSVPGIGVVGALASRFQARGLSYTLLAMAAVHALLSTLALATGPDTLGATLSAFWLLPWLLAAALFRMAGAREKV